MILFPLMFSQRCNMFSICSASDEIHSTFAHHLLSNDFEMSCDFPLYWACAKICYSLAEHMENHFGASHAFSESSLSSPCHPFLCPILMSLYNFLCPLSNVFVFCHPSYMSPVLCLCSLSPVLCPLSHVSVSCLPSAVPSLTSLFLVSRLLAPVLRIGSLPTVGCPHAVLRLCSLYPVPSSIPCLTALLLVSRPLYPVSRLCSLSPVLCTLSHGSAPCLPSSVPCLTWSVPCLTSSFLRLLTSTTVPVSPFSNIDIEGSDLGPKKNSKPSHTCVPLSVNRSSLALGSREETVK